MNANAILGWIKSHLVIVVCTVLILVLIPVGWVISSGWTKGILADRKKELDDQRRQLTQAESVTYVVPPLLPDEPAIEYRAAPNPVLTSHFQRARSARASQADAVLTSAVRFNRGGDDPFEPLVDGLFPVPSSEDPAQERRLTIQLARMLAGDFRGQEPVYRALFEAAGAGSPPDSADVQATMNRVRELTVAQQGGAEERSPEEAAADAAREARIAAYAQRAREISFYADWQQVLGSGIRYPRSSVGAVFTLDQAFEWQFDYWLVEMLLNAVAEANTPASGLPGGVPESPIKRVLLIDAQPPAATAAGGDAGYPGSRGVDQASAQAASHTGRTPPSPDAPYVLREADISLVVSSDELVRVIEGLGRSNFITVTGVRISNRDEWQDLADGYFYGDEHVVQLDLHLETIWLDVWLTEFAPPRTRELLGLPEPASEEDVQSSAAAF